MALDDMLWAARLAVKAALAVGAAVWLYQWYALHAQRQRMRREHGCQPLLNKFEMRFPWVGIESMALFWRAAREGRVLEVVQANQARWHHTFHVRILTSDSVETSEPDNIQAILSTRFKDYTLGTERVGAMRPLLGHGIFAADGARWQKSRNLIRPAFTRDQIADIDSIERHFQRLRGLLPGDGATVDLQPLLFALTLDSATEFLFGASVDSLESFRQGDARVVSTFAASFDYAQRSIMKRFRLRQFQHLFRDDKDKECIDFCHSYVRQFVDDALRSRAASKGQSGKERDGREEDEEPESPRGGKYVFLQELARHTDDPVVLRDEVLNILLAGRDTTASVLSNLFFTLARRPDVWAKLRGEIGDLNGQQPTYEALRNLKYTKYCVNEALRLWPAVPINARKAIVDTVLPRGGGPDSKSPIFLKKGTIAAYSVYAMHRRTDLYGPDAGDFNPERWQTIRPEWSYLPFNGGPRICPGQQYALTEAMYVLVRFVQEFPRMESRDAGPWVEGLSLTLCSKNGTKVGLYERG